MPLTLDRDTVTRWHVRKIAVVGPGIVGMPMAALLADARIREGGEEPARVVVVQRDSPTSGWKVGAINEGRSPIGGVEPGLDRIVAETVRAGLLSASHDYAALADADLILVSVQTDKAGIAPDYGPLFEALTGIARALRARHGLEEGRDVLLGNSPNRVMPGRLVERVAASDKIIAGLHPATPGLVRRIYGRIVTRGTLHETNSLTAEVVKTLENAYRDVRIAYAAEVARWCDACDVDFFALRDRVNERARQTDAASADAQAVPSGGLLVPMLGVGGHCLPKDGVLLWWRALEAGADTGGSLILEARRVNDESPAATLALAERAFGPLEGRRVALLGAAYRGNSEDTRNSPTLVFAHLLRARGATVTIHDPYVYPSDANLRHAKLEGVFTRDPAAAVRDADVLALCCPHRAYADGWAGLLALAPRATAVLDACNLLRADAATSRGLAYAGIGRGHTAPSAGLVEAVFRGFEAVERGVANEVAGLVEFLNARYAASDFNRVRFAEVQRLVGTCPTGGALVEAGPVAPVPAHDGFRSRLVARAVGAAA